MRSASRFDVSVGNSQHHCISTLDFHLGSDRY